MAIVEERLAAERCNVSG